MDSTKGFCGQAFVFLSLMPAGVAKAIAAATDAQVGAVVFLHIAEFHRHRSFLCGFQGLCVFVFCPPGDKALGEKSEAKTEQVMPQIHGQAAAK